VDVETKPSNGITEIRISGYGGQGVVLAGLLLGKAAALYDGKSAVFTQSYGPEARGGASCADVIISDSPVDYPLVTHPGILVALFQEAYVRYRPQMRPGGVLILESDLVRTGENEGPYCALPATKIADKLGRRIVANVVVLGYVIGKTGIVRREAVEEAIRSTVKKKTIDLNISAFEAGYAYAQSQS
jgi:2-oxoglutarate ferredoxin oxidoreductase subunit gamma